MQVRNNRRLLEWVRSDIEDDPPSNPPTLNLRDFGFRYCGNWLSQSLCRFHEELIADLESIKTNRGQSICRIAFRGAAKTTWVAIDTIKGAIEGYDPYTLVVKDSEPNTVKDLAIIADHLEESPQLLADYGVRITNRSASSLEFSNGSKIDAMGAGQSPKGRKHRGIRPTKIIADDIESTKTAVSPAAREALLSKFRTDFLPAGEPGRTNFVFLGTPAHLESAVQAIRKDREWRTKEYVAIETFPTNMEMWRHWAGLLFNLDDPHRDETAEAYYQANRDALEDGAKLLWKERFPLKFLMSKYMGDGVAAFLSEYQLSPWNPATAYFEPQCFDLAPTFTEWEPTYKRFIMSLDPATGADIKRGDDAAIALMGIQESGRKDLDFDSKRRVPAMTVAAMMKHIRERKIDTIVAETNGFQGLIVDLLEKAMKDHDSEVDKYNKEEIERCRAAGIPTGQLKPKLHRPSIRRIEHHQAKETRIMVLASPLAKNEYRYKAGSPGVKAAHEQGKTWPSCAHDDLLDAWSMAENEASKGWHIGGMR